MKEIEELLSEIDDSTLKDISKPKKKLVQFLKEIYSNKMGDGKPHA